MRTFEAVARLGTLTAAGKALGLSQSTISRQLDKLEAQAGSPLLVRKAPIRLTERGEGVFAAVRPMVDAALAARAALEESPKLHGEVTVTTVGEVTRWVLARELPAFYRAYPSLRLRILVDNRVNSLAAGEADIALRLKRPQRGGLAARRVYRETYAFCAAADLALHTEVPWLGLTGSLADVPEQVHAKRAFAARPPRLLVEDVESLGMAVEAGLGVALLSGGLRARLARVVEVAPSRIGARDVGPTPVREVWMVVHRAKQHIPKVRAVMRWLEGLGAFKQ